jgi:hypothetical protein
MLLKPRVFLLLLVEKAAARPKRKLSRAYAAGELFRLEFNWRHAPKDINERDYAARIVTASTPPASRRTGLRIARGLQPCDRPRSCPLAEDLPKEGGQRPT